MSKTPPLYDAAMTFREIASELGISVAGVQWLYSSGLKKIRRHPYGAQVMRGLGLELERERAQRSGQSEAA